VRLAVTNRGRPVAFSTAEDPPATASGRPTCSGLTIVDRLVGPVTVFSAEGRTLAMVAGNIDR
jgi:hypothetical protein